MAQPQGAGLSSTTAPGKIFVDRAELAAHYKSDWHKYNLKRKEAGLPVLLQSDFEARLAAAKALRKEQKQAGKDHLKHKEEQQQQQLSQQQQQAKVAAAAAKLKQKSAASVVATYAPTKATTSSVEESTADGVAETTGVAQQQQQQQPMNVDTVESNKDGEEKTGEGEEPAEMEINIDPCQSLFDNHMSDSVEANVEYMHSKFSFFIPDKEYLSDMEGLIGYCHEMTRLGKMCLYCHRVFSTLEGCQTHMMDKNHMKIGNDEAMQEDLAVFYDFETADQEFVGSLRKKKRDNKKKKEGDEDGWEDMSEGEGDDDEDMGEVVEDDADDAAANKEEEDDYYGDYMSRLGFDVTPLGELIFPDGRIVGHRDLRRYYKQRAPRPERDSAAVVAARSAAGERIIRGRVYNISEFGAAGNANNSTTTLISSSSRNTQKLLSVEMRGLGGAVVVHKNNGIIARSGDASSISQISLYRFRASIRKERYGQAQARRLHQRTSCNKNRMDKKANRLMNDICVAQAAR